jgi:ATP-dependent helicase/DNAse subunit B
MPLTLVTGPAHAGKARVLIDAARGHLAHGQEPLLIVPSGADAERRRRELADGGAVMGVRVERFEWLLDEAVRRAGVGRPALGGLARERALARILAGLAERAGESPGAGSEPTPGHVRALAAFLAELQARRVTPRRLNEALREWRKADSEQPPGGPVGAVFERYQRLLRRIGRDDAERGAVRALDELRRRPALWRATPVLFCGFIDFGELQIDAIETLGAVVDAKVTVSLTYEPGRTAMAGRASTFQTLLALASEHRELPPCAEHYAPAARGPLSHLERSLFEPGAVRMDPGGAVRLLEGRDERDELELVAREIGQLLREGLAPEEIAVAMRTPAGAAGLLEEVFASAEIPYALRRLRPFRDTGVGRALIGSLRCAGSGGEVGDLLAWLRAPGLLAPASGSRARASLELADRLERDALQTGATSAAQARALWDQRHWPLARIDHLRHAAERGAGALIAQTARELRRLFCTPRRGQARVLESDELDEAQALVAGERALAELAQLARLAPELAPGDPAKLARILEEVMVLGGERAGAGAVAVLDPLALAAGESARGVRVLFVCGLQEGIFPAPVRAQPFLAEEERRRLAMVSGLRLTPAEDGLASERFLFYAAASRPRELLVLSWHVADDEGRPAVPSLFVDDLRDLYAEELSPKRKASRRAQAPRQAPPSTAGERGSAGERGLARERGVPGERRSAGERGLAAERSQIVERGHTWSASSLELWIRCPVRWLVERMLRAGQLGPDSEPIARGGLAHAALKDTFEGLRRETGSARLTASRLELARELMSNALAAREGEFALSVMPERGPGVRRRLESDLTRYLRKMAGSSSALEPIHCELAFGFQDSEDGALPALDLGRGLTLRGRIDRVDLSADGGAVVYDYKGRLAPTAERWIGDGNLQVALYMLAVEGLLGLRIAGGFYQPLTGGDLRPRGVLDRDAGVELECVRGDLRGHAEVRALLEEALASARDAAAQAERGEVQARPQTCRFGGGCMYPTVCRCEA